MYARLTTWEFDPGSDQADRIVRRNQDEVLPAAKTLPGFKGFYAVINRDTGKAATFTLWEDEKAERASLEAANKLRSGTRDETGVRMTSASSYEVIVQS